MLLRDNLVYGTMRVAGSFDGTILRPREPRSAIAVLKAAHKAGFRYFDTAPLYALGRAEVLLGEALHGLHCCVETKVGVDINHKPFPKVDFSPKAIESSLEGSLKRLNGLHVSRVYFHNPPARILQGFVLEDLTRRIRTILGAECRIGVSLCSIGDSDHIAEGSPIDSIMVSLRDLMNDSARRCALERKYNIVVREVFIGGTLIAGLPLQKCLKAHFIRSMIERIPSGKGCRIVVAPRTIRQLCDYCR